MSGRGRRFHRRGGRGGLGARGRREVTGIMRNKEMRGPVVKIHPVQQFPLINYRHNNLRSIYFCR